MVGRLWGVWRVVELERHFSGGMLCSALLLAVANARWRLIDEWLGVGLK